MRKKRSSKYVNWRKLIVMLCVFTVLTLLPIVMYLYLSKTIQSVADNVVEDFLTLDNVDTENSSNYQISEGQLKVEAIDYDFGTGADGSITISSNTDINTVNKIADRSCADGGDAVNYSVTALTSTSATLSTTPSAGCLAEGDEVLLINLKGVVAAYTNVGNYETLRIESISENQINFTTSKINYYGSGASDDSDIGTTEGTNQIVMLQRVPNYTDVTINSGQSFYPSAFNGLKGGVLFFKSTGIVNVVGTITASGYGFRGGSARTVTLGGYGGESYCHFAGSGGGYTENGQTGCGGGGGAGADSYFGSRTGGVGSIGGGGGGGGACNNNDDGATGGAGGGGGHGSVGYHGEGTGGDGSNGVSTQGGSGGNSLTSYPSPQYSYAGGGGGGGSYGIDSLNTKIYMGSGAGGGSAGGGKYGVAPGGAGGAGGGIIVIFGPSISVSGTVSSGGSNGAVAGCPHPCGWCGGAGGGGAGGSVKLFGADVTLGASKVTASAGSGALMGSCKMDGGNGSVGRIRVEYIDSISGTTSPSASTSVLSGYQDTMVLQSNDLVSGDINASVLSVIYNLSTKPVDTSAFIQYSTDAVSWYNSSGIESGETLSNTTDLVAQWNFNNTTGNITASEVNDVTGTLINFSSSTGQDVVEGSGWTLDNRLYGAGSIMFDGASSLSDYILVNHNAVLNPSGDFTIGTWVRPNMVDDQGLVHKMEASSNVGYSLSLKSDGTIACFVGTEGSNTGINGGGNATYTLGEWQHIVCVRDNDEVKIYRNGVLEDEGSIASTSIDTSTNMGIGTDFPNNFGGVMDTTYIFTRALSPSEILSYYQNNSDELTTGENNEIDLSALEWVTNSFYYKIVFDSNNGLATPVLDDITLTYDTSPAVPTIGDPEALSTNTIRWYFTDNASNEGGFMLMDEEDNFIQYCLGEDLSYCDETDLDENTQYVRKVRAYNEIGESDPSESATVYTLVSTPSILPGGSKTSSSVTLTALGQVNNSEVYFDCVDTGCDTGINNWVEEDLAEVTGLDFNTPYEFRVKGRNSDNVETIYSDTISIYTLAEIPSISISPLSSTSLSLASENVNNISSGNSGIFFECEGENCEDGITEWLQEDTATVINLNPNSLYFFKIKARNSDGIETVFSEYIGGYTYAAIPQKPLILSSTVNSLGVGIDEDDNPEGTMYSILEENTGKYVDFNTNILVDEPVWGSYDDFGSETGVLISSLDIGTEYLFKIKARNEDEIETEYSEATSGVTKLSTPTNLSALTITRNSFTWTVTDSNVSKTGYKIYDTENNLLLTCTINNMVACIEGNLLSNTSYSRKVKVYSEKSESDFSNIFVFTTYSEPSTISTIIPLGPNSVRLSIIGSNQDNLQIIETTDNTYFNSSLGVLTPLSTMVSYASTVDIVGLASNTRVEFKVRSLNKNNVATVWSSVQSTYTHAEKPALVKVDKISNSSAIIYIDGFSNPADTEFLVRENNSGRYLDFSSGTLVNTEKWGTINDFGSTEGVIVNDLEIGSQYGFSVRARNKLSIPTDWSNPFFIGTTAILRNVDNRLKVSLRGQDEIDLTDSIHGQFGEKTVRVKEGNLLVADIPILFSQDRDWVDAVVLSSAEERKTVVKLLDKHGLTGPYTMYIVKDDTNAFILCPEATSLEEVSISCINGKKFTGSFPQSITYEGNKLSVSHAILEGTEYWIADGITGTGGLGYYEEEPNIPSTTLAPVKESIKKSTSILQTIKDRALGIIDSFSFKNMPESELQRVATTANAVTITVGTTALLGGLTQLGYSVIQFFAVVFSSIGFRRKRVNYGFVYDSNSKEPINMALVRIYSKKKRLVDTAVTDMNGRFSASLKKGKYVIKVSKSGYEFPSIYVKGPHDYPLQNVYTGSLDILSEDSDVQTAIPIDPKEILGGQMVLYRLKTTALKFLAVINIFIFLGGVGISTYAYYMHTNRNNLIILLFYIVPLFILLKSFFNRKGKYGKVVDEKGKVVSGIAITIREKEFNKIIAKRVTNTKGKYRFILDKGKYELSVAEKGWELVDIKRGTFIDVRKDNYILAEKIKVKKS